MSKRPAIGVCYYPEHWPEQVWERDAKQMAELGITYVRMGEFAWSRLEPTRNIFNFEWLDKAISILASHGLKIVLCTPTATPPRWMLDEYPDMLALDADGRARGFGSRRHYCFSHQGYRQECEKISELIAKRYGSNPSVAAWQTDNEYGCHETVLSWSDAARQAFQAWLEDHYEDISDLNKKWGNVFWSMEFQSFTQIDLPNQAVTECNPAHIMAFRHFSSDQVISFNALQTSIIRRYSDAPITHNMMGKITSFDHFELGADLDFASWDSYPLGFFEQFSPLDEQSKNKLARQGDPDFQAFHHDLYRRVGQGRFWIMEQQPGPVNWAPWNPFPHPGMVRLWAMEAFAHGAECVSYFRWRQAPFAQEQMHAGLMRPDFKEAPAMDEIRALFSDLKQLKFDAAARAEVALVFSYKAQWASDTERQGLDFDYFDLVLDFYRALRRLGVDVDLISPDDDLDGYSVVIVPGLMLDTGNLIKALKTYQGVSLLGPRFGTKTENFSIRQSIPPGLTGQEHLNDDLQAEAWFGGRNLLVTRSETMRPGLERDLSQGGCFIKWFDELEGELEIDESTLSGDPAIVHSGCHHYIAGWPDERAATRILAKLLEMANVRFDLLPAGLRRRAIGSQQCYFNYSLEDILYKGRKIPAASYIIEPITDR